MVMNKVCLTVFMVIFGEKSKFRKIKKNSIK